MNTYHKGDLREDGLLFWGYRPTCKNGEYWVTREHFAKLSAAIAARPATPPSPEALDRARESRRRYNQKRRQKQAEELAFLRQFYQTATLPQTFTPGV